MNRSRPIAARWNLGVDLWRQSAQPQLNETPPHPGPNVAPAAAEVREQYVAALKALLAQAHAPRSAEAQRHRPKGLAEQERLNCELRLGAAPAMLVKVLARLPCPLKPLSLWLEGSAILYALCPRTGMRLLSPRLADEPWQASIAGALHSVTLGSVQPMDQLLSLLKVADPTFLRVKEHPDTALNLSGLAVRVQATQPPPRVEGALIVAASGQMATLPAVGAADWAQRLRKTVRLTDLQLQRQLALVEQLLPSLPSAPWPGPEPDAARTVLPPCEPASSRKERPVRARTATSKPLPVSANVPRQDWMSVLGV